MALSPATTLICIAQNAHCVGFLNHTGFSCIVATANLWAAPIDVFLLHRQVWVFNVSQGRRRFQILSSDGRVSFFGILESNFEHRRERDFLGCWLWKGNKIVFTVFHAMPRFEKSGSFRTWHFDTTLSLNTGYVIIISIWSLNYLNQHYTKAYIWPNLKFPKKLYLRCRLMSAVTNLEQATNCTVFLHLTSCCRQDKWKQISIFTVE